MFSVVGIKLDRNPLQADDYRGLKARDVRAWAEASPRAQAQVKVIHIISKA